MISKLPDRQSLGGFSFEKTGNIMSLHHIKTERNIRDSQNFLHSAKLVEKLVGLSNICRDDLVLEIGPGKGIITNALKGRCKRIIAVEKDAKLYDRLCGRFMGEQNITLLNEDFLDMDLPDAPYKIFSNIPFNMTADILVRVLFENSPPTDIYVVMQREAVWKYIGEPYYRNRLKALCLKPDYAAEIIYVFDRRDFSPPAAEIVFAHFQRKKIPDIGKD